MPETLLPDAMLVERIAALGDKSALVELDARYGMTLYAIAYNLLLDSDAADVAVAATLREVWRHAASFSHRRVSVRWWLGDLTRRAARQSLKATQAIQTARRHLAPAPLPTAARPPRPRPRRDARLLRLARFAKLLARPVMLLAYWAR